MIKAGVSRGSGGFEGVGLISGLRFENQI